MLGSRSSISHTRAAAADLYTTRSQKLDHSAHGVGVPAAAYGLCEAVGQHEGDRVVTEGGLILDGQAQLARAAITEDDPAHPHGPSAPAADGSHSK